MMIRPRPPILRARAASASLVALLVAACGASAPPVRPGGGAPPADEAAATGTTAAPATGAPTLAGPAFRRVDAETAITTGWNAVVTLAAGWSVADSPTLVRARDPEGELTVSLLVVEGGDRAAAIKAAWARVDPTMTLAEAQAVDIAGRDGWDAMAQVVYVSPAGSPRLVVAIARRHGTTWHLALVDGTTAAIDRRGAQLGALVDDMKVPGVDRESLAGKPAQLDAAHLERWAAFVDEARQAAGVPGVAIAVVHGGKIVLERGLGVREVGRKGAVTPATRFMIGSTTKALTSLLLARLVDQGKLRWDTPVTEVLPEFALADRAVTAQVQVRHTVCACTGMPRQDLEFLFEYAGWDAERRLASMATMKPTTGFGETFQYSNVMVATGGWVAARVASPRGKLAPSYAAAMEQLVLRPLGMRDTTFEPRVAVAGAHARSHGRGLDRTYQPTPLTYEDAVQAVRPAGAAWSTVRDLARYLLLELSGGRGPDGVPLLSTDGLRARRQPQVKIDADSQYGLGLFLHKQAGLTVLGHGGNMLGFTSDLFFLPDHDVGVVVLTNAGAANAFRAAVHRAFLEIVFDGAPRAKAELTEALAVEATETTELAGRIDVADEAWVGPLLGSYADPALGTITLRRRGAEVVLDAGEWSSAFGKLRDHDGTIKLVTTTPPYLGLTLAIDRSGDAPRLMLDAGQHVYTFAPVGAGAVR